MLSTSIQNSEEAGGLNTNTRPAGLNLTRTFNSSEDGKSPLQNATNASLLNMTGGKKTGKILMETTQSSRDFYKTGKTSNLRGKYNKSPENNEDNVRIDDNSSNDSGKKDKPKRFTPLDQRRPKVVYF